MRVGETVRTEFGGEQFEWSSEKSEWTLRTRGFSFSIAAEVFFDATGLVEFNSVDEHGEERYHIIGRTEGGALTAVLFVVYSERENNGKPSIRIISARKASSKECHRYQGMV